MVDDKEDATEKAELWRYSVHVDDYNHINFWHDDFFIHNKQERRLRRG
jgi:hypothetical protein